VGNPETAFGEYYIDTDPGIGEGTAFTLKDSGDPSLRLFNAENVSTSQLLEGTHILGIRIFTEQGEYTEIRKIFAIWEKRIAGVEYQIGTQQTASEDWSSAVFAIDGAFDSELESFVTEEIATAGLPEADRYFAFVRALSDTGLGGEPQGIAIQVSGVVSTHTPGPTPSQTPTITPTPGPPTATPTSKPSDINKDGFINKEDLFILQRDWHDGWRD